METTHFASFDRPDDVVELDLLRSELVSLGGLAVSRTIHQPGWRWSTHVRPQVGGEWCQTRHLGIAISGRIHIVFDTGSDVDLVAGSVYEVVPGHDAWVVGDAPYVDVTWAGARTWLPTQGAEAERVLATVLFTDIVDSTAIARSIGDRRWSDLISTHEERVRDTLVRFHGREVKTTGDGVLAVFNGAGRALRCAMALREVAQSLGLSIRSAVHSGELDLVGSDVRGVAVHEASRILGLAGADQVLVSATVRDLLDESDEMFEDLGEFELRGLPRRRRIFAAR